MKKLSKQIKQKTKQRHLLPGTLPLLFASISFPVLGWFLAFSPSEDLRRLEFSLSYETSRTILQSLATGSILYAISLYLSLYFFSRGSGALLPYLVTGVLLLVIAAFKKFPTVSCAMLTIFMLSLVKINLYYATHLILSSLSAYSIYASRRVRV